MLSNSIKNLILKGVLLVYKSLNKVSRARFAVGSGWMIALILVSFNALMLLLNGLNILAISTQLKMMLFILISGALCYAYALIFSCGIRLRLQDMHHTSYWLTIPIAANLIYIGNKVFHWILDIPAQSNLGSSKLLWAAYLCLNIVWLLLLCFWPSKQEKSTKNKLLEKTMMFLYQRFSNTAKPILTERSERLWISGLAATFTLLTMHFLLNHCILGKCFL